MTYCLDLIVLGHKKVFTVLKEMMSKSKQQQSKERYYLGQYVNRTELARGSNTHKVASVFLPEFCSFKIKLLLYSYLKDAISRNYQTFKHKSFK